MIFKEEEKEDIKEIKRELSTLKLEYKELKKKYDELKKRYAKQNSELLEYMKGDLYDNNRSK
jgi:molecular chaperone GrpE (heat shock protein)